MSSPVSIFDTIFQSLPDREDVKKKMTVGEAVEYLLREKGCPEDVVNAVTAKMRSNPEIRIGEFWDKEYRSDMIRQLVIMVNITALEYLNDRFPDAWFTKEFCSCDQCTGKKHKRFK